MRLEYVFAKGCIFVSLSVCAGGEWGSVVCFVCRRPWMLSRLQLGTAMVHAQCRKQQEQATYKLNGHTLKIPTFTLASSSMSSRAMKQAIIDRHIMLGCQSEQEVQGIFRFIWILTFFRWIVIYIRLVWFQCKVTILFTVFKLASAPLTLRGQLQQQSTACTYSPSCPLTLKKVYEVKQADKVNNISRICNTEQQEAQQKTLWCILGACYQWLSWAISPLCNYAAC